MHFRSLLSLSLLFATVAQASDAGSEGPKTLTNEERLQRVAAVHGGSGPWAVAGFRMGEFVAKTWGITVPSFDIEVEHRSPAQVQYSCVLDGAAAATGASAGKLSLKFVEVPLTIMDTTFRHKPTGRVLTLRVADSFKKKFTDVPREKLGSAGAEVLILADSEIFQVSSGAARK